jgi:hypothetical protein
MIITLGRVVSQRFTFVADIFGLINLGTFSDGAPHLVIQNQLWFP